MDNSIIKWWNVHYMTPQELAQMQEKNLQVNPMPPADYQTDKKSGLNNQMSDEQIRAAQEIIDRLNREAKEDERKKQQEIVAAREAAEKKFDEEQKATKGTIDHILAEKDEALRDMIAQAGTN